ncbi:unnamed protein product [Dovyalis caffra]|uniref:Uncharacterized protein n=1 Tax=Dovyalis caffra TaxID=77055 RepID=A0AAV1QRK7_9ROSI|nr:unnamed protein product [Dovyalis caffra]
MEPSPSLSTIFHDLFDLIKKFLASDTVPDFFFTIFHRLLEVIKKVMASDTVSDFTHTLSELIKKFMASDAVSDFIHKLSDIIQKVMASDAVLYLFNWFKKENVTTLVAVVVIGLLIYICCKWLPMRKIAGKTMKAPGQSFRILRKAFEANPSAYFKNLRGKCFGGLVGYYAVWAVGCRMGFNIEAGLHDQQFPFHDFTFQEF